jgi:hypothetical protein
MASASSKSAKNLFADSKKRLGERVQVNVNNMGSIVRQVQRGSKSNDILSHTTKQFCQAESVMDNSFNNLQKTQVLMAQLAYQQEQVKNHLEKVAEVNEQIRDMQR